MSVNYRGGFVTKQNLSVYAKEVKLLEMPGKVSVKNEMEATNIILSIKLTSVLAPWISC